MNSFNGLVAFLELHNHLAYAILFVGSYFETLIGSGFFLYGEFIFLPGAILAGIGVLNIWLVALACILGGILGDTSSYFIGKKYGIRVAAYLFKDGNKYLTPSLFERAKAAFQKSGTKTIFFARFLGPLSWITPFMSGTLEVNFKKFLTYNIPGVILGISQYLLVGYFLGFSYQLFLGKIQAFVFTVITLLAIVVFYIYKRKAKRKKAS